jgi:hypothetical protein
MQLTMSSCGNPDFGQNPSQSLSPAVMISVSTFQEASQACQASIDQYDLGGGKWTGGQLVAHQQQIARVSYNGRVWDMDDHCIYEPTND